MMNKDEYASIESQLGEEPCNVEDTKEIFWLRESDDYQSRISLGNALSRQYRFKEAIVSYESALRIRQDDPMLYIRLGGANLTLFCFEQAMIYYEKALSVGAEKKSVSYPLGVWYYMKREYETSANYFANCLPCGGEMKIAVIYWHTLAAYKAGLLPDLLHEYNSDMDVGHHTAYKKTVSVFYQESDWNDLDTKSTDLDAVITLYGISCYLEHIGEKSKAIEYLNKTLDHYSVWPCISYLMAWRDQKYPTAMNHEICFNDV